MSATSPVVDGISPANSGQTEGFLHLMLDDSGVILSSTGRLPSQPGVAGIGSLRDLGQASVPGRLEWREMVLKVCAGELPLFRGVFDIGGVDGAGWLRVCAIPVSGADSRRVSLSLEDCSPEQLATARLQKLAAFPELNPNPVVELDELGEVTYFNNGFRLMMQSLGIQKVGELLPRESQTIVRDCLQTGKPRLRHEVSMGDRIISWSFYPVATTSTVHCYAGDVSERHQLEAQLRHAQKMESIGRLASGVAHDFNNVLTIIQGRATEVMDHPGLDDETSEGLREISMAAERASALARQLLLFGQREKVQPRILDLNDAVGNVSRMLRRVLGEDIALHVNFPESLPLLRGDPGMLEQVVVNLSVRAKEDMPGGGTLSIRTSEALFDESSLRKHPLARIGHFVCLSMSDTGRGISPTDLSRVFEPFYRDSSHGHASGLGLATVQAIVEQHRGWVEVSSIEGQGTTFEVFLPAETAAAQTTQQKLSQGTPKPGSEVVLVAEDDPGVRDVVTQSLSRLGYVVIWAASGPEAVERAEERDWKIDLLVTDVIMPEGMDGRLLARRLSEQIPALAVLFISGYVRPDAELGDDLEVGVNFLPKPFHPNALANAARAALEKKRAMIRG